MNTEQSKILETSVDELSPDQLFDEVPLADRLAKHPESAGKLCAAQRSVTTELAYSSDENRAREARIRKIGNSGLVYISF